MVAPPSNNDGARGMDVEEGDQQPPDPKDIGDGETNVNRNRPRSSTPPVKELGAAVDATKKQKRVAVAKRKVSTRAGSNKSNRPPPAPTSGITASSNIVHSLVFNKMSTASGSSSQAAQTPSSQASHPEATNDSQAIELSDDEIELNDDEGEDVVEYGSKRKLTSAVWKEFTRVVVNGQVKAKCMHCFKKLSGKSCNGTKHLKDHLKSCSLKKIKMMGNKTLAQPTLRFGATDGGKVSVENYTYDQDIATNELVSMIVLHEYPLSMVDHAGFRRFVAALQPLFQIGTRNTIRNDIKRRYEKEKKKAIEYMAGIKSRVAITTDMWTADNQKRGYMAITTHFIDES